MVLTVRRGEQIKQLKALGAEVVLNSQYADFCEILTRESERLSATIALDVVAGSMTGRVLAMPAGSKAVVYGLLSHQACEEIDP